MYQSKRCSNCGSTNQLQARFCFKCGGAFTISSPNYYDPTNPNAPSTKKWLYTVGAILGLVIVGGLIEQSKLKTKPANTSTTIVNADSTATPAAGASVTEQPLTPAQRLQEAKNILNTLKTEGGYHTAKMHLEKIPADAPEAKEAQKLLAGMPARLQKLQQEQLPELREQLKLKYQLVVANANPHLNFIGSKYTNLKGGFALWATHDFFSQYTFKIGDDAKIVSNWIDENYADLKRAKIVRVGVMGEGAYASWAYFDIK